MSTRQAGKRGCGLVTMEQWMSQTRARGRLFERPEAPRPFRITPRDLSLLANLARLRLASGEQLAALDGGSEQNVSRSLLVLVGARIRRALARAGREARALQRIVSADLRPDATGRLAACASMATMSGGGCLYETDKQRRAGWRFIEHRVDITEFMVRLELACRGRTDVASDRAKGYCRQCAEDAARSARASHGEGAD